MICQCMFEILCSTVLCTFSLKLRFFNIVVSTHRLVARLHKYARLKMHASDIFLLVYKSQHKALVDHSPLQITIMMIIMLWFYMSASSRIRTVQYMHMHVYHACIPCMYIPCMYHAYTMLGTMVLCSDFSIVQCSINFARSIYANSCTNYLITA